MDRLSAILLIGPTGSGKTPLGQALDAHGLAGVRCVHFDFGENLRLIAAGLTTADRAVPGRAASGRLDAGLTEQQSTVVAESLKCGSLLDDGQFDIARKILVAFIAARNVGPGDLIVLNGLPRHVGQAAGVDAILHVRLVVRLSCAEAVVLDRIRSNAGGDRSGRADDDIESVKRKLAIFERRTVPLLAHYGRAGAVVETFVVSPETSAADLLRALADRVAADRVAADRVAADRVAAGRLLPTALPAGPRDYPEATETC